MTVESNPRNVVLLCIDDLGAVDLGFSGSTFHETPTLDRLANESAVFDQAYSASVVCSPSRAGLLTGRTPARFGLTSWIGAPATAGLLDSVELADGLPEVRTLPTALRDAGLQTWHVGKWHLGGRDAHPLNRGFDRCFGGGEAGHPRRYYPPYRTGGLPRGVRREHLTERLARESVRLVSERDRGRAFFLNLWHYAVHTPIQAPDRLIAKYVAKRRELGLGPSHAGLEDVSLDERLGFGRLQHAHLMRRHRQSDPTYAAMIEHLDRSVDHLMNGLADEGVLEDTLVVVTSDNGGLSSDLLTVPPTSNAPYAEGKGWTCEGGIRVPLMVHHPATITPARIPEPVIGTDVMPTLLDAVGADLEPETHCDGVSLLPLAAGVEAPSRSLFWHFPHYHLAGGRPAAAVRLGRWKLVRWFEQPTPQLFDLEIDPGEQQNRAVEQPDVVADLDRSLNGWLHNVGASVPAPNLQWSDRPRSGPHLVGIGSRALTAIARRRHESATRRAAHRS